MYRTKTRSMVARTASIRGLWPRQTWPQQPSNRKEAKASSSLEFRVARRVESVWGSTMFGCIVARTRPCAQDIGMTLRYRKTCWADTGSFSFKQPIHTDLPVIVIEQMSDLLVLCNLDRGPYCLAERFELKSYRPRSNRERFLEAKC